MALSIHAESARPDEWADAFRLIFQHTAEVEREQRVANALEQISGREFDPAGLLIVRHHDKLLGAMLCMSAPGATGLVWPPQASAGPLAAAVEDCLVNAAEGWLRQRGAKLAQALLAPQDAPLAAPLERNGFTHITSLDYLGHQLDLPTGWHRAAESLTYRTYSAAEREEFHRTLMSTYEGSLDCPELNNVRSIGDVIDGHRAQGKHDPEHWWLAFDAGRPVGTLLLAELPEGRVWDLSYIGIIPEARGRRLGQQLVRKALFEAWAGKAKQLTLAVDVRNFPARKLYQALGFDSYEKREVFLAVWP